MPDSIRLSTNIANNYDQFNVELQKLAELNNEDQIALVINENGAETIEIKTATFWDRVVKWLGWECLDGKKYQESEVQRVMQVFLDNNQNFVELAIKVQNIPLSNDRIFKYIPHNFFCNFLNGQIALIDSLKSNANSKIGELETQIIQADIRKRQIEDEINMLRSSRNQLIGESIPETQPVHEPRQYQTSQFLEALRENSKSADIILISSDGKEIHAHSPFLNDSGYFLDFIGDAKFFTNLDAESLNDNGKCTLNFTDSRFDATTINHFLDLKYGIPLREKLTQTQIINLLYFSRYVLDESLKDEMLIILFKDLNIDNSETLLPGLFNVVLDFTDDLAKQFTMFNKFKNLLSHVKPSIKLEWFEVLSQHEKFNNPSIHYWLGFCYERGIGVEIDKETAFITWLRAGEQHYALAQFAVGDCYFNGHGVEKDLEMSFYWNTLAADQGYGPAQHDAGWKYMRGEGVEKNFEKAFHRFKLAADQGYGPAQCSVEQCYHFGYGVEKNFEEAIRWSCKVVNQNSTQGLEVLSSVWKYQY